jgi:hypothetical protein
MVFFCSVKIYLFANNPIDNPRLMRKRMRASQRLWLPRVSCVKYQRGKKTAKVEKSMVLRIPADEVAPM